MPDTPEPAGTPTPEVPAGATAPQGPIGTTPLQAPVAAIPPQGPVQALPASPAIQAPVTGKELEPVKAAGVQLAWGVLGLITGFLLLFGILVGFGEWYYASYLSRNTESLSAKEANQQFIESVKSEHKEFREFWLKLIQTVLVNVLLPVLTALLGYIFATSDTRAKEKPP